MRRSALAFLIMLSINAGFSPVAASSPAIAQNLGPPVSFNTDFQKTHRNKTDISVPEVYELVNIAISLTEFAQEQSNLIAIKNPYYDAVSSHFFKYKDDQFVKAINIELRNNIDNYFYIKMNAITFFYDSKGKIDSSKIYLRVDPAGGSVPNVLLPYLPLMREFSKKTGFREFYNQHRNLYRSQVSYLRENIDVKGMMLWLSSNFPDVPNYDYVNVIFSPLVGGNQSLAPLEDRGFRELQAHVNFPYSSSKGDNFRIAKSRTFRDRKILFTELNHGYINPTAEKYIDKIDRILKNRECWAKRGSTTDSYSSPIDLFNEMMNWGLISLYYTDRAPSIDRDKLIAGVIPIMIDRGFLRFTEFNKFLVDLYRRRPQDTTVAELYPEILAWFAERECRGAPAISDDRSTR